MMRAILQSMIKKYSKKISTYQQFPSNVEHASFAEHSRSTLSTSSQQSKVTPSLFGQQSPSNPSQAACAEHCDADTSSPSQHLHKSETNKSVVYSQFQEFILLK